MSSDAALLTLAAAFLVAVCADAADLPRVEGMALEEVRIPSSADGKQQPIIIGVPEAYEEATALPLLVGLHTWSAEYAQMAAPYGREAARRGWLLVCPHFRGANLVTNPHPTEAGGSLLAQRDIIDAIAYMQDRFTVDDRRIYMVGGSGGGHMTCLMASKYPDLFAAATAWCPITDLRDWHAEQNSYAQHIEAICGGKPGDSPEVDFEYARRAARVFITNAAHTNLLIGHGDKDPIIAVQQSWDTFRALKDLPDHRILFQSWSAGHSGKVAEGLDWAATKVRALTPPARLDIVTDEAKGYFWLHLAPAGPLTFGRCTAVLVRAGDKLGRDAVAERTVLTLETTDVAEARVDLAALRLDAPADLPEGVTREGDALVLRPGPGAHRYEVVIRNE